MTGIQPSARRAAEREGEPLLRVRDLAKHFPVSSGTWFRRQVSAVRAVERVSFDVHRGETLALVGASGCGKSTVARTVLRLLEPSSGQVTFHGEDVVHASPSRLRALRRDMQIVFQEPFLSLNPRLTVHDIVSEPYRIYKVRPQGTVGDLLEMVGLSPEHAQRYPHEFSGGQRQRISIARAIALVPHLVFLDDPVSALDASVQAQLVNLLDDLQAGLGLTYVFITRDLSIVRHFADRVAVMYFGHIVEIADCDVLFAKPAHPYTQALISAIPVPDPARERQRQRIVLQGDVPSPSEPPSGCPFHPRCPKYATLRPADRLVCRHEMPELIGDHRAHAVACHYAGANGA